jgi:hypothetical protein
VRNLKFYKAFLSVNKKPGKKKGEPGVSRISQPEQNETVKSQN